MCAARASLRVMSSPRASSFRLTSGRTGSAIVLVLDGELDVATAPQLVAAVAEAVGVPGSEPLFLDAAKVSFMDSSGIRALLESQERAEEAGRRFALVRPSGPVTRVLDLVNLRRFEEIEHVDDRADGAAPPA